MRSRLVSTVAALVVLPVLAACGGKPSPEPAPYKPSGSASTSKSPSASAQARAAVADYVTALNAAGTSGDTSQLRALSDASCDACLGVADFIDSTYRHKGSIAGEGWTVKSMQLIDGASNSIRIDAVVDVAPQVVTPSPGAKPQRFKGGTGITKHFTLKSSAAGWHVTKIESQQ